MSFYSYCRSLLSQLPEGRVTSFSLLAGALGDRKAARTVAGMMKELRSGNLPAGGAPWHRVVSIDGHLTGTAAEKQEQRELLEREGVQVETIIPEGSKNNTSGSIMKVREFDDRVISGFDSVVPLEHCRRLQERLRKKVSLTSLLDTKEDEGVSVDELTIAGFDLAYTPGKTVGAAVVMREGMVVEERVLTKEDSFPYIPGYLSFRELPTLLALYRVLRTRTDVCLVDGNSILHPRGLGLASHLGVLLDASTIGVAKSRLTGRCSGDREREQQGEILQDGRLVGFWLKTTPHVKNPVYISPGHRILAEEALELVRQNSRFRLPEQIRRAHSLAAEKKRQYLDLHVP